MDDLELLLDDAGQEYKDAGKELLIFCPYCNHHNPKLSINKVSHLWRCLVCAEAGSLGTLVKKLRPESSNAKLEQTWGALSSSLPAKAQAYLASRGLLGPFEGVRWHGASSSLVFAFRSPQGALSALKWKGTVSKFYRMEGTHPGAYWAPKCWNGRELVICEGEIDALSIAQLCGNTDMGVAALTGASNHKIVDQLNNDLTKVYLWLDNDEAGKKQTPILAQRIKDKFPGIEVRLINCAESYKDPNDFLVACHGPEDFQNLLSSSTLFQGPSNKLLVKAADILPEMFAYLSDKNVSQGIPTMIDGIDALLGGGKRLGEVTALQSPAKSGKNSLWHQMMYLWLQAGIPMGYASRELSPATEVLPNILSIHCQKNMWKFPPETAEERGALAESVGQWPLYFAPGYGVFNITDITRWVVELKRQGVQHFWLDHFHYMLDDSENPKEISKFARELKTLAKEQNIHIDIIIQPKHLEEGSKMGLSTLRGGAAIGQAIDNLLILERQNIEGESDISRLRLSVARHKLARPGREIYLKYCKETTSMVEVKLQDNPQQEAKGKSFEIL